VNLKSQDGVISRQDGLPYDITKINGKWVLRATGNPAKPVVVATLDTYVEALLSLVAVAPEAK
jgi:hypothetical protein